jgi:hypothetical protein
MLEENMEKGVRVRSRWIEDLDGVIEEVRTVNDELGKPAREAIVKWDCGVISNWLRHSDMTEI